MSNIPNTTHPLVGHEVVYRPFDPPYGTFPDNEPGLLVVGNGMTVVIRAAYNDWNEIAGLAMFRVFCPETGQFTHLSERELGVFLFDHPHRYVPHPSEVVNA